MEQKSKRVLIMNLICLAGEKKNAQIICASFYSAAKSDTDELKRLNFSMFLC